MDEIRYPDLDVQLVGRDGNAFSIIGNVSHAIKRAHGAAEANAWTSDAMECESYDELLRFVQGSVNVS